MKRKVFFCIAGVAYFVTGYFLTNHFHLFEPRELPLFEFEKKIPFIPWTAWIYVSDYVYLFSVIFFLKGKKIDRYFYSASVLMTIHFLFFIFLPTVYPRNIWDPGKVSIITIPLLVVRLFDTPANCFPSMHVGACALGVLFIWRLKKKFTPYFLIWAVLIAISTLTTRQHYVLDIFAGPLIAVISYWVIFRNLLSRKRIDNTDPGR